MVLHSPLSYSISLLVSFVMERCDSDLEVDFV